MELYDVILEGEKESPDSTRPSLAGGVVTHPGAPFETPPRLSVASPEGTPAERQLRRPEESPAVPSDLLAEEGVTVPGAPFEITIADMLRGVKDADGTQIRRLRRLDRGSSPSSHRLSRF